jgi:hypothetical protein
MSRTETLKILTAIKNDYEPVLGFRPYSARFNSFDSEEKNKMWSEAVAKFHDAVKQANPDVRLLLAPHLDSDGASFPSTIKRCINELM